MSDPEISTDATPSPGYPLWDNAQRSLRSALSLLIPVLPILLAFGLYPFLYVKATHESPDVRLDVVVNHMSISTWRVTEDRVKEFGGETIDLAIRRYRFYLGCLMKYLIFGLGLAAFAVLAARMKWKFDIAEGSAPRWRPWLTVIASWLLGKFAVPIVIAFVAVKLRLYFEKTSSTKELWAFALFPSLIYVVRTCVFAPITEEIIFRGCLQRICMLVTPGWFAVLVQALLFAAVHPSESAKVNAAFLGIILGIAYLKCGRLWVTMLIHALANLSAALFVYWR